MSWWKIDSVENGQVDPKGHEIKEVTDVGSKLYNGDGPADVMGAALDTIAEMYVEAWGRPPKLDELRAVFNFVTGPDRRDGKEDYTIHHVVRVKLVKPVERKS